MKNLTKILFIMLAGLSIFIFNACSSNQFIVKNNAADIKIGIENFINRGGTTGIQIDVKNECDIDNIKVISYTVSNGQFGHAVMERKSNNSYKIKTTEYGTNIIEHPIVKTKNGKYLLAIGRKYNQDIEYLRTEVDNRKYIFDVSGQSYFIQYYQVPQETAVNYSDRFILLDRYNKDITTQVKSED